MPQGYERRHVTDEDRRALLKILGITGAAGAAGGFSLGDIRNEVPAEAGTELAAMGQAIRNDLSGSLDASVLASGLAGVASSLERLPELAAAGVPTEQGEAFQSLTDEAWVAHEHLVEAGFFASAERHLPPFVPDHISSTAQQLIGTGSLSSVLSEIGFGEEELTAVATAVATNDGHLAKWKPTDAYPAEEVDEFDPADIAPLHQRATEGALLWIDGLDHWLWQNRVLVTEEMLADGIWDIKAMLGGYYLMGRAAHDMASGSISDEQLTAMVTAGSAIAIISQEHLTFDLIRVTDEMRPPRGGA